MYSEKGPQTPSSWGRTVPTLFIIPHSDGGHILSLKPNPGLLSFQSTEGCQLFETCECMWRREHRCICVPFSLLSLASPPLAPARASGFRDRTCHGDDPPNTKAQI